MRECLVNRAASSQHCGLSTWGELLQALDAEATATNTVVSAVRFDGVDQPSFRDADVTLTALSSLDRVEADTVTTEKLLQLTIRSAEQSLPALATGACHVAQAFRGSDVANANRQLATLIEAVRTLTMVTVTSATASGAELEALPCGSGTGADVLGAVGIVLGSLAQEQAGRDWIAVADALEYDLAPALLQWGSVFEAIQERCAA